MKRLSEKQYQYQIRRSKHVIKKRLSRRLVLVVRREKESTADSETIYVPAQLMYNVDNRNRKGFESFTQEVGRALSNGKTVFLNFSKTTKLYPCGVLVFMGLVDEWQRQFPDKLKGEYPTTDLVEQMLQHIGIIKKLGLEPRKTISHNDVIRWHYFTGMNVDASGVETFMDELRALIGEEKQMALADCVNEAMTNVKHHAYGTETGGRWWIMK